MALSSATPARSSGREAVDPRQACEPCWTIDRRTTPATHTYLGDRYCEACLRREGIAIEDAEAIPVVQPEREAAMATPATALKPNFGRGKVACKCGCGNAASSRYGYVKGHGPTTAAAPRKTTVTRVLSRKQLRDDNLPRAIELHDQGMSTRAIASELGVSGSAVQRWLSKPHTPRKPRGVMPKLKPEFNIAEIERRASLVTVEVTEQYLNDWFTALHPEQKAKIFKQQFTF